MASRIEPFYPQVGKRLLARRLERGLTQEQVGERLTPPMTRASIANIEAGKQRILTHTFVELARLLDAPLESFLPPPAVVDPKLAQALVDKLGPDVARGVIDQLAAPPERPGDDHEQRTSPKAGAKAPRRSRR